MLFKALGPDPGIDRAYRRRQGRQLAQQAGRALGRVPTINRVKFNRKILYPNKNN